MRYICTSIVVPLVAAGVSQAATIHVPDDYPNIYQAVAVAIDGDVIEACFSKVNFKVLISEDLDSPEKTVFISVLKTYSGVNAFTASNQGEFGEITYTYQQKHRRISRIDIKTFKVKG